MDTDKNGQLSLAEFKAAATAKVSPGNSDRALQRLDANKDGKVSAAEFRAPARRVRQASTPTRTARSSGRSAEAQARRPDAGR